MINAMHVLHAHAGVKQVALYNNCADCAADRIAVCVQQYILHIYSYRTSGCILATVAPILICDCVKSTYMLPSKPNVHYEMRMQGLVGPAVRTAKICMLLEHDIAQYNFQQSQNLPRLGRMNLGRNESSKINQSCQHVGKNDRFTPSDACQSDHCCVTPSANLP